jgi:hypothetical protein
MMIASSDLVMFVCKYFLILAIIPLLIFRWNKTIEIFQGCLGIIDDGFTFVQGGIGIFLQGLRIIQEGLGRLRTNNGHQQRDNSRDEAIRKITEFQTTIEQLNDKVRVLETRERHAEEPTQRNVMPKRIKNRMLFVKMIFFRVFGT